MAAPSTAFSCEFSSVKLASPQAYSDASMPLDSTYAGVMSAAYGFGRGPSPEEKRKELEKEAEKEKKEAKDSGEDDGPLPDGMRPGQVQGYANQPFVPNYRSQQQQQNTSPYTGIPSGLLN